MLSHLLCALVLVAGLASTVRAEAVVISFSDLKGCKPCRQLEAVWQTETIQSLMAQLPRRRIYVDVTTTPRKSLRQWGVAGWPTTFLVEQDAEGKITEVYRKHVGTMTIEQLSEFVTVPESKPR